MPSSDRLLAPKHLVPLLFSVLFCMLAALAGCGGRSDGTGKYRTDLEEMMPIPYTPRDDGQPLSASELHAFKTVSDLDRHLSEEEAHIVELHFKFFVHQNRRTMERFIERSARFLPYIKKVFNERGIPNDISYLCMVESGGNPNAVSRAGAAGLWQFMPFTGRKFGLMQNKWIDERRDPYKATFAASDYLLKLYGDFANWHLAVAAYNAGEGKIGKAVAGTGAKDFFDLCRLDGCLEERARLRDETRDYVPRLIAVAKIMRNLKRLGFSQPAPDMAWDLKPLELPPGTNLAGLAKRLGLTWDEFSGMNPAFRRTASPPAGSATAYVPPDKLQDAVNWAASSEARSYAGWREYTIKKGDTLASVAKRHGVSQTAIREANGFDKLPGRNAVILIPGKGGKSEPMYDALPASASSAAASAGAYVVQSGDTLFGLAQRWGTDVASVRLANRMGPKESILKPGQRISVPGNAKNKPAAKAPAAAAKAPAAAAKAPAAAAKAPATGGTVTVKAGDTLYSIARTHGTSVAALQKANKLGARSKLKIGQKLKLP
ncbi:LysM peptidoglycan-binding domain-containing protein [Desulfovibrio sp. OttesenSCG-928-G11]|nr:LysM peptidoglycan-binding domain-containing protein [Desulfovibrio sp. OttesenSCG-928-G11]